MMLTLQKGTDPHTNKTIWLTLYATKSPNAVQAHRTDLNTRTNFTELYYQEFNAKLPIPFQLDSRDLYRSIVNNLFLVGSI